MEKEKNTTPPSLKEQLLLKEAVKAGGPGKKNLMETAFATKRWYNKAPLGYYKTNHTTLVINQEEQDVLEELKEFVESGYVSWREAAQMFEMKTGKKVSYEGLRKRLQYPINYLNEIAIEEEA